MTPSRSRTSRPASAALCGIVLLALCACGPGLPLDAAAKPLPRMTHASQALSSGLAPTCAVTTVHDKHASMFPCSACHPCGATFGFAIPYTFAGGTTTAGGTLARRTATAATTCTVACHFPNGAPAHAITWDAPGPLACTSCHATASFPAGHPSVSADASRSDCERCHATDSHMEGAVSLASHGDGWMDPAGSAFHGSSANLGLGPCQTCHGEDLGGGISGAACAECHGSAGQLVCTSCHGSVPGDDATRSSHLARAGASNGDCTTCHDASQQAGGHYRLPAPGGSFPQASCLACHDGRGELLGGRTPPSILGWNDAVRGDWHGARAGTGYGGTLSAPYARGAGPLPCTTCHDSHSTGNAFLLASTVNGTAIPAASIDRAGVGAHALCGACHEGDHHAACLACHASDPEPPGSPCFWCHGHEGIVQWTSPDPAKHAQAQCRHCHGFVQPPTEYVAPLIDAGPDASSLTATTVTIRWSTIENATSYVEYGVGAATTVAGDGAFVGSHWVTVTGLQPATTYVWRVRSSDQFRNVTTSPLATFTTPGLDDVPPPDLGPVSTRPGTTTAVAALVWYPVLPPPGTTPEYEVQLASDAGFTVLENANLPRADDSLATGNSGWIPGTPIVDTRTWPVRHALQFEVELTNLPECLAVPNANPYYFRVRTKFAPKVSAWSTTGSFTARRSCP